MLPRCPALTALFFLLFINCPLRAQEPSNTSFVFRHITTSDGLAGNDVRNIIQDHKGYIWIATDNGVQRYDGSGFITFHHDPANAQSQPLHDSALSKNISDTATVCMYVERISDIDFRDQQYAITFWLEITYHNPLFDFTNQLQIFGSKKTKITLVSLDSANGQYVAKLKIFCTMGQDWDVDGYPFDGQHLNFKIYNAAFDSSKLNFVQDGHGIHNDTIKLENGWSIHKEGESRGDTVVVGYGKVPLDEANNHSILCFSIDIHRAGWGIFFKCFIGMYVAFFVAYIAFFIDIEKVEPRFGLPVGALFAAIANKYVIESLLPQTPKWTIVDWFHFFTFFSILLVIYFSSISLSLKKINTYYVRNLKVYKLKKWIAEKGHLLILFLYLSLNIILIIWATTHEQIRDKENSPDYTSAKCSCITSEDKPD